MNIEWLTENEDVLRELVAERDRKEDEICDKLKAIILSGKFKRTPTLSSFSLLPVFRSLLVDEKAAYFGKNWYIDESKANLGLFKIIKKSRIKELLELADTVYQTKHGRKIGGFER